MSTRDHDDLAKRARRRNIPDATRIPRESGLAEGAVYLYFRAKEEIFLALSGDEFLELLTEVGSIFDDAVASGESLNLDRFIGRYAEYLKKHPEFLRLDAMSYSVLEQNMDADKLREFKLGLLHAVTHTGGLLDAALNLSNGRGTQLLSRMYAITRGLWQSLDCPPALRDMMADDILVPIRPQFDSELVETLTAFWRSVSAV